MSNARDNDCTYGSDTDSEWKEQGNKRLSLLFHFLSDPKRIIILRRLIWEKGVFPDQLAEDLNISRTTAFDYIKKLHILGIVDKKKIGHRHVLYQINKKVLIGKKFIFENVTIDLGNP
jgi:predicted transcriptional regulator